MEKITCACVLAAALFCVCGWGMDVSFVLLFHFWSILMQTNEKSSVHVCLLLHFSWGWGMHGIVCCHFMFSVLTQRNGENHLRACDAVAFFSKGWGSFVVWFLERSDAKKWKKLSVRVCCCCIFLRGGGRRWG